MYYLWQISYSTTPNNPPPSSPLSPLPLPPLPPSHHTLPPPPLSSASTKQSTRIVHYHNTKKIHFLENFAH